jgi:hypothetical protein
VRFSYLKDIRALALMATSFAFDLVEQQIDFAGALTNVFVSKPRCAARAGTTELPSPAAKPVDEPVPAAPAPAWPTGQPGRLFPSKRPWRRSDTPADNATARGLKSITAGLSRDEPWEARNAIPDEHNVALAAQHDPFTSGTADELSSSRDRVEKRAYALWEDAGHPEGRHLGHWLQAEREISEALGRTADPHSLHRAA